MSKLIYGPSGVAVPDHQAWEYARKLLVEPSIHVSTENVVNWARVLVKEKELKDLEIEFGIYQLHVDKNGRLDEWPNGFCDTTVRALERLI